MQVLWTYDQTRSIRQLEGILQREAQERLVSGHSKSTLPFTVATTECNAYPPIRYARHGQN